MAHLKWQVPKNTLENPICIAIFDNDGIGGDLRQEAADKLREKFNGAGIKFAATNSAPPIRIFVEKEEVAKLKTLGIKLPTVFDLR